MLFHINWQFFSELLNCCGSFNWIISFWKRKIWMTKIFYAVWLIFIIRQINFLSLFYYFKRFISKFIQIKVWSHQFFSLALQKWRLIFFRNNNWRLLYFCFYSWIIWINLKYIYFFYRKKILIIWDFFLLDYFFLLIFFGLIFFLLFFLLNFFVFHIYLSDWN